MIVTDYPCRRRAIGHDHAGSSAAPGRAGPRGPVPTCRGLGHLDLDVQYLPDITVQCPTCQGARYNDAVDVATLVGVLDRLLDAGATIIVIDHDLDLLAAADHLIDMGPGGGPDGGRILAAGAPADVARNPGSVTGPWLAGYLGAAGRPALT